MVTKSTRQGVTSFNRNVKRDSLGNVVVETKSVAAAQWVDDVTYGDNIPGWRQLLKDGLSATTSLTGTRSKSRILPGTLRFSTSVGQIREQVLTGVLDLWVAPPGGNPSSSISETKANTDALGKFAVKIAAARASLQGGVVLGELGQTLRMLRNPAMGLRRLVDDSADTLRAIRSSRRLASLATHKREVAKNLADAWLELQFGWKPLLHDIRDGCKALDAYDTGRPLTTRRITAKSETEISLGESQDTTADSLAVWRRRENSIGRCQVIYRGAVRVGARDPKTMEPSLLGFSPEQFLPTAWELIPYSFLIDYFTNIGEIISGWSTVFMDVAWANKTTRRTIHQTRVAESDKSLTSTFRACAPATVVAEKTNVVRAKYNGTYVPDFTFTMPSLDSKKWLNIAALIVSRNSDRSWFYD